VFYSKASDLPYIMILKYSIWNWADNMLPAVIGDTARKQLLSGYVQMVRKIMNSENEMLLPEVKITISGEMIIPAKCKCL
jgi:hypothetical protein